MKIGRYLHNSHLVRVLALMCALGCATVTWAEQSKLKTYGYFDMEVKAPFSKENAEPWSFDQHHLNLITIYTIDDRFRVFTEVEYEHGPTLSDSESSGRIYLAKGFLEYKHSDALKVRVGKFLSPFGIYNERHDASPTFIATKLPHAVYGKHELATGISDRLFAKFATGIQLVGNLYVKGWDTKYHFYVSNGRGNDPASDDDNSDKGRGGRLVVTPPVSDLHIGVSYYTDKHGLDNHTEQRSLGFDVEFDFRNLHLESELLAHRAEKVDTSGQPIGSFRKSLGVYAMAAYTFADKVTPFVRYESNDHDLSNPEVSERTGIIGLNLAFTPRVYFKNEVHSHHDHRSDHGLAHQVYRYRMYITSLAVAF